MSFPNQIRDSRGNILKLNSKPLGVGGEGSVFDVVGNPDQVAKIYNKPQSLERSKKLKAMVNLCNSDLLKIAAWPTDTLHADNMSDVSGILMPRIKDFLEIHHLYSVGQRKRDFPEVDWAFLLHTARNCAIAFEEIHRYGHVIGDVNQKNVMVSKKGIIALVDCDSFQVRLGANVFRCNVGVPEYTPPELQGRSFASQDRESNHDLFGLAILIFHLLMMGRHPYSGVPVGNRDLPMEQAILGGFYAYTRNPGAALKPPPKVPPLHMLDPGMLALFEKAFKAPGNTTNYRPTAQEWRASLDSSINQLARCKNDPRHSFLKVAVSCPWCNLIASDKLLFFIPTTQTSVSSFHVPDYNEFQRQFLQIKQQFAVMFSQNFTFPNVQPQQISFPQGLKTPTRRPADIPNPPPPVMPPKPAIPPADPWLEILTTIFTAISIMLCTVALPIGIIGTLVFGFWTLGLRSLRLQAQEQLQIEVDTEYNFLCKQLAEDHRKLSLRVYNQNAELMAAWGKTNQVWVDEERKWKQRLTDCEKIQWQLKMDFESLQNSVKQRFNNMESGVPSQLNNMRSTIVLYYGEIKRAELDSKRIQFETYLDQFFIRNASIKAITNQRVLALESFGIETAKDIDMLSRQKVPGIGPVLSDRLMQWRDSLTHKFVPTSTLPANERSRINTRFAPALLPLQQSVVSQFEQMLSLKKEFQQKLDEIENKLKVASINALTSQAHLVALNHLN